MSDSQPKSDRCQACEFYGSECVACKDKRNPGWDMYPCKCRVCKVPDTQLLRETK